MANSHLLLFLFVGFPVSLSSTESIHGNTEPAFVIDADYGQPLFLTPYVQSGQLKEARNLSLVGPLAGTTRLSYSGYFTVNPTYNSNIFFWYFPATKKASTAPVVVWLQGGPGDPSTFGLFVENGPFYLDSHLNLRHRKINWATPFNMIYFDNPVGTGFSFTEDDAGYARNETDVARDLYEALIQFFTIFTELQPLDFYVNGESYGGKFATALSYKIHSENPTASLKINLKGLAIGDGLIDPVTQLNYGDYLYNVGLIDSTQLQLFIEQQTLLVKNIANGDFMAALYNSDLMMTGGSFVKESYYKKFTHLNSYYNYLDQSHPIDYKYYPSYLMKPEVKKAIHVGNLTLNDGKMCKHHLLNDICQSVKPWVEELLNNDYRVLFYHGQLDVIVPYCSSIKMIQQFKWKGAADYGSASRIIWKIGSSDKKVAGYVKQALNFMEVMVRDAGHILPYDQPRVAYDLITRFVFNKSFV